jgi:hypothetical protein
MTNGGIFLLCDSTVDERDASYNERTETHITEKGKGCILVFVSDILGALASVTWVTIA